MHKLLLYINTDIFLPTRRGEKKTTEMKMITVRAAAAPLSRSSGSVTDHQKRRFSVHSPAQIIGISPDDLSRWEFPCGRKWRQDFFFSAEDHSFQNQPNSFSVQTVFVFFQFSWLVWHQNPPWKVLPAVKQEVKSFKLLLPPVRARVMCSETPAVRGNVSVTFF